MKILGIYFSCNHTFEQEKNFLNHIVKIKNILRLLKLINLTIEERIFVFKSLAIPKIIHLAESLRYLHQQLKLKYRWNSYRKGKIRKLKAVAVLYVITAKMAN